MTLTAVFAGLALIAPAQGAVTLKPIKTVMGVRPLAMAAAPTGTRFAASLENNTIRVYDVVNMKVVRVLIGHPVPAYAVAWHPNGQMIASGDESARIFLWDIKTGAKVKEMRTHIRGIQNLSFDASGNFLLSTGKDDVVKIYDTRTGKEIRTIKGNGANFYSATYTPGGGFAVATLGDGIRAYAGTKVAKKYTAHSDKAVWDFDFHTPTNRLISAGRDGTAAVFDLKGAKRLNSLKGHEDWVVHVRITPNGRYAVTGSTDRTVRLWDLKTYKPAGVVENMTTVGSPIAITANGQYVAAVNMNDWLQVFELVPRQGK